ncbi:hypothetical protein AB4Y72_06620 [Arthrobacter sp. YAF34]|uniref:hypothetical protein n=1 Tax=Arthrobacter sp. YAF34 TaxID=3233083 RepID=UPI003F921179
MKTTPDPEPDPGPVPAAVSGNDRSGRVKIIRRVLAVAGVLGIAYGLLGLPTQLGPTQLVGLLAWLAAAVVLHDGVVVPVSTLSGAGLARAGVGLRPASSAVLRGALMVGTVVTLLAALLLKAQSVARNVSVLEGDYAAYLAWFWAVLLPVSAAAIVVLEHRPSSGSYTGRNRQKTRP